MPHRTVSILLVSVSYAFKAACTHFLSICTDMHTTEMNMTGTGVVGKHTSGETQGETLTHTSGNDCALFGGHAQDPGSRWMNGRLYGWVGGWMEEQCGCRRPSFYGDPMYGCQIGIKRPKLHAEDDRLYPRGLSDARLPACATLAPGPQQEPLEVRKRTMNSKP
jgi:hypothetical protein